MAATTKLIVWNAALRELGAPRLVDTTTANTRQAELADAWDHAVELTLAGMDWGFARRRATLASVADTSFPPYTRRMSKPADYLRKCWIKAAANDEYQIDHAEVAAVIYAFSTSAVMEYVSDHADNYDPANWPPHFTRVVTLHLASLVAPKLARAGAGDVGMLDGKTKSALADAEQFESVFLTNTAIPVNRQPVMRRALEFMGQSMAGSVPIHAHADKLRWAMNRAWEHSVRYVLEQGAWNFASKRARLTEGFPADSVVPSDDLGGIDEGYSYGSVVDTPSATLPSLSGFDYAWPLPDDYLHKIWLKRNATDAFEVKHQVLGDYIFVNDDIVILEYIAENATTTNPENWSANFLEAVAAYLAVVVSPELMVEVGSKGAIRVDGNQIRQKLEVVFERKLSDAKLRDAIQQYPAEIAPGRFRQARAGGTRGYR